MKYYTDKGRDGQDKLEKTCRKTQHVKIDMERDVSIIICRMAAVGENYNSTRDTYTTLLTSGKLNSYLAGIDEQAQEMFSRLVKHMAEREGVTEQLKAENGLEWTRRMNNIRACAMELVNEEIIYN